MILKKNSKNCNFHRNLIKWLIKLPLICFDLKINRCSCESRWNCCHARLTEAASHRIADWGLQTVFSSNNNNNNNNNCSNKKTLVDLILLLIGFSVRTEIEENLSHFRPFQNFKVFPRNKKNLSFLAKICWHLTFGTHQS